MVYEQNTQPGFACEGSTFVLTKLETSAHVRTVKLGTFLHVNDDLGPVVQS